MIRVVIPDSHGEHIDLPARDAFLGDLKRLNPDQIVFLGDHLDAGGTFNAHQKNYTNEMVESYEADVSACNTFLDLVQKKAPKASIYYLEGNHEAHVQRWAARMFESKRDADMFVGHLGPEKVLQLKSRGIRYFKSSETYMSLSIPGTIRLGKCYFCHGICHGQTAAQKHLAKFGEPVVFGHIHKSVSVLESTVTRDNIGAWCPGTLAKLQPLYKHTSPSGWTHGYAVQFVAPSERFLHLQVPIVRGKSLLMDLTKEIAA